MSMYIYICVCVCVCVCKGQVPEVVEVWPDRGTGQMKWTRIR